MLAEATLVGPGADKGSSCCLVPIVYSLGQLSSFFLTLGPCYHYFSNPSTLPLSTPCCHVISYHVMSCHLLVVISFVMSSTGGRSRVGSAAKSLPSSPLPLITFLTQLHYPLHPLVVMSYHIMSYHVISCHPLVTIPCHLQEVAVGSDLQPRVSPTMALTLLPKPSPPPQVSTLHYRTYAGFFFFCLYFRFVLFDLTVYYCESKNCESKNIIYTYMH